MKKHREDILSYSGTPHIELNGSTQCVINGLKGINEYTKEKIKINLGKYFIVFYGDELYINSFSYEGAIVEGNIISLEFESYD